MSIEGLLVDMKSMLEEIPVDDPLRLFHGTYTRTTEAVRDEIRASRFTDNEWVEAWDVAFAQLYLDALGRWRAGAQPSLPWQVALEATRGPHLPPLRYVLLGMNAHINFDLPQALLAVITPAEFENRELIQTRASDHTRIDGILASRVAAEDGELMRAERPGDRTVLDRILTPFNRVGTKRFLAESRTKVWLNAIKLNHARLAGAESYAAKLDELERRAAARVEDLRKPGQVLLELSRNGFGVLLD